MMSMEIILRLCDLWACHVISVVISLVGMRQLQSNYPNNCGKVPDFP